MRSYDKTFNIFDLGKTYDAPLFVAQRVTLDCPICNRTIQMQVLREYVDWESVAEYYKGMVFELIKGFQDIGVETELLHGENPAHQSFNAKIQKLLHDVKRQSKE